MKVEDVLGSPVRGGGRNYTEFMRRGRWTGIAAALVIAVAATVTAGCGGGSSGNALSLDPVAAAATKTQQAGAAKIRFDLALSGSQLQSGKTLRVHGDGAIDGTSTQLTVAAGSTTLKEISLEQNGDYVFYLSGGPLAAHLPSGKQWAQLDLTQLGKSAGLDLGKLLSGSGLQPGDLLSLLEAQGAKIDNLGSATIDGAATTHYRVTIDIAKALQANGLQSSLLGGLAAQLPSVPVDVWIGQDGLVHRIGIAYHSTQNGKSRQLDLTLDVYDYGADVTIAAPPSSDVFDATQIAQLAIGTSH